MLSGQNLPDFLVKGRCAGGVVQVIVPLHAGGGQDWVSGLTRIAFVGSSSGRRDTMAESSSGLDKNLLCLDTCVQNRLE